MARRNVYQWPFARTSIWNTPIGSGASYVPAGLAPATAWKGQVTADPEQIGVDPQAPGYPEKTLTSGDRVGGGEVRVPPDMRHRTGTGNSCATLLRPDGRTVWQGQPLSLSAGGNPSWTYTTEATPTDLTGPGVEGCHGGSHLSGIGGSLRLGELDSDQPLRHALKMNLYCARFCSPDNGGYRWPASTADTGYRSFYHGSVPQVQMGTLLALPPDTDLSYVTSPKARKIAEALRDYGAYVVDDTAWNVHAVAMDERVSESGEWPRADPRFHAELMAVITKLAAVQNNGPDRVGGGGIPRAPRAPCLDTEPGCPATPGPSLYGKPAAH